MKKIFILLVSFAILSALPVVEAKVCCVTPGGPACFDGSSCPSGLTQVDCMTYCNKCTCCGSDSGCPSCGSGLCSGNVECYSYSCTGRLVPGKLNWCNTFSQPCCSDKKIGLCDDSTSNPTACSYLSTCSEYCGYDPVTLKPLRYYNGVCTGGVGSAKCSYSTQSIECCLDADCASKDCASQGYPGRIATCDTTTYTCGCGPCNVKTNCKTGWCCEKEVVGGTGQCRQKGYIYNNRYLCDPPEGFVPKQESAQAKDNFLTWLTSLFNFLSQRL